jgi:hypothetical protein
MSVAQLSLPDHALITRPLLWRPDREEETFSEMIRGRVAHPVDQVLADACREVIPALDLGH